MIDRGPAVESRSQEFQSSGVAEWILLCWSVKVHRPTPKMNLQLLELSNKRATGNIVIHKSLLISILRKKISALSRPKHGFDPRTRCQIFPGLSRTIPRSNGA